MTKFGGFSGEQLRQYIERVERLEQEKQDIADNIRDAFAEAKGNGFDVKIMRQIIKLRKMEASDRDEQDAILDLYKHALGMLPEFEPANAAPSSEQLIESVNASMAKGAMEEISEAVETELEETAA